MKPLVRAHRRFAGLQVYVCSGEWEYRGYGFTPDEAFFAYHIANINSRHWFWGMEHIDII